jgi:murein DD-endopeptidase MepM/ murein hydrolase activator NlpD
VSGKHFTFMIVPPDGKHVLSTRVPSAVVAAIAGAVAVCTLIVLGGAFLVWGSADKNIENSRLAQENHLLKERLQGLEGTISELRAVTEKNSEFQRRAQILADFQTIDDDARKMGIGGPVFPGRDPLGRFDLKAATTALELETRLEEIETQCRLQESSFDEILRGLEEQKEKWAHIPSINPVPNSWTSSGFGMRTDPFTEKEAMHIGLDFSAPAGTPVYATADGTVISAGRQHEYGLTVEIDHGNGIVTRYAHNRKLEVKRGQKVKRGQMISLVGKTGRATAPHMHYEVRVDGKPVNPWGYILTADVIVD